MTSTQPAEDLSFEDRCRPLLNVWGPYRLTRDPVTETAIRRFCEVAEDANPVYWDEDFARTTRFGRVIAPPQSLFSMTFGAWWTPDYLQQKLATDTARLNAGPASTAAVAEQADAVGDLMAVARNADAPAPDTGSVIGLCDRFGYTVNTVAGQEVEYLAPFGPGDGRLKMRSMTTHVSPEKRVRVGRGVFITSITEYRTEVGDRLIGRSTLVLLRYRPEQEDAQ